MNKKGEDNLQKSQDSLEDDRESGGEENEEGTEKKRKGKKQTGGNEKKRSRKGSSVPDIYIRTKADNGVRFDGEVKLTWELNSGTADDVMRLPTGPNRDESGKYSTKKRTGGSTIQPKAGS